MTETEAEIDTQPEAKTGVSAARKVLIIKLGAFGDFILAMSAFQAIRKYHAGADITLLTIPSLVSLAQASEYFDQISGAGRPRKIKDYLALLRDIKQQKYDMVYDLQTNDRTRFYYYLMRWVNGYKGQWLGHVKGCSHLIPENSGNKNSHPVERYQRRLQHIGYGKIPYAPLDWAQGDISHIPLPSKYVLFVAGCAPQHHHKRWPAEKYAALGRFFVERGIIPVLIGTETERDINQAIQSECPDCVNATGQTDYFQLASLARGAHMGIGNDTGPMHLLSSVGVAAIVLYSGYTDPARNGQRGPHVLYVQEQELADLSAERVMAAVGQLELLKTT